MILRSILALALCAVMLAGPGCFRQDRRTITVNVPQLKGPECLRFIQDAAQKVEGIEQVSPSYESRTVDVTYNAMKLGIKNIEFIIAGAGFDANNTQAPAAARAALPEGCR